MNYKIFSKLQFRPLLKKFFHKNHIDLRDEWLKNTFCIRRNHSSCFDV